MEISACKHERGEVPIVTYPCQAAEGVLPHFTKERVKLQHHGGRRLEM